MVQVKEIICFQNQFKNIQQKKRKMVSYDPDEWFTKILDIVKACNVRNERFINVFNKDQS